MYNIKTKGSDTTPANGGQQAFLKSKEVNTSRFEHQLCKSIKRKASQLGFRVRRAIRKQKDVEISMPVMRSNQC
ncbi:unnamed protein product [Porites evermanni]|uniref:Uncharacterized protein n=1 Tax=Porites evermanni TaxID=104178 RepID=A0ABN8N2T1_9CNID|nr:unnamed protein product [Porites evermanni]